MSEQKNNFHLKKIKVLKNKSIIEYKEENGAVIIKTMATRPHDDLLKILSSMEGMLASTHYLNSSSKSKVKITGISISGDENEMIVLTGILETANGAIVSINSPRISLNDKVYSFEENLSDTIEILIHEVSEYVFNNKCNANPELDFPKEIESEESEELDTDKLSELF